MWNLDPHPNILCFLLFLFEGTPVTWFSVGNLLMWMPISEEKKNEKREDLFLLKGIYLSGIRAHLPDPQYWSYEFKPLRISLHIRRYKMKHDDGRSY